MTHPDIVQRLREHATDWDGKQMPDLEPAKGDPTAGTLRQAATEITTLRQQLADAREAFADIAADWTSIFGDDHVAYMQRRASEASAKIDATLTPGGNHG